MNKNGQVSFGFIVFAIIMIVIFGLITLFSSIYTINETQRGVLLTWGKANDYPMTQGVHLKFPFVQEIIKYDVTTQKYEVDCESASKDLQTVHTKMAINFKINGDEIVNVYKMLGTDYANKVLYPAIQESVKSITATYTAEELITKREEVKNKINDLLFARMKDRNIIIEASSIINFDFSEVFNQAIELKVVSSQNKLKADNDLERMKVEAEQKKIEAEGYKEAKIQSALGDAESIKIVNDALSSNPNYLDWLKITKWNGVQPMYVGGNAQPMITIN
jgi:regulator of protease activity HflC (stomatin/prohibitin superfamily)